VREDSLLTLIDAFFATRVFGTDRLAHFRKQSSTLGAELESTNGNERERASRQLGEVEQRIERQLAAIEAGVDPVVVGERIRALKSERGEIEAAIAQLEQAQRNGDEFDVEEAVAILDSLPDLSKPLAEADPELRRSVFEAFRLRVEIDRNSGLVRLKALVSSAFSQAKDLGDVCATTAMRSSRLRSAACRCGFRLTSFPRPQLKRAATTLPRRQSPRRSASRHSIPIASRRATSSRRRRSFAIQRSPSAAWSRLR
jgi:hypothetical protein